MWSFRLGPLLTEPLHLILVIEGINEEGRGILSIPLVLFRILTEGENDRVDRHLNDSKEERGNNITKSPTSLQERKKRKEKGDIKNQSEQLSLSNYKI